MRCDRIWRNARLATLAPNREGLGIVDDGLVACRDGLIAYAGPPSAAPATLDALEVIDCQRRWVTPGLIDCHTHLVYAGDRAHEFEQRLNGVSYEAIARNGGGILSTVNATRAASEAQLVAAHSAAARRAAGRRRHHGGDQIRLRTGARTRAQTTARGARTRTGTRGERPHHLPRRACTAAGIRRPRRRLHHEIAGRMLAGAGMTKAWSMRSMPSARTSVSPLEQTKRVFNAATQAGLRVKLHAEQLSNLHGAALAAEFHALSADHLEYVDDAGIAPWPPPAPSRSLLPGAFYFLRETQLPPVARLARGRRADGDCHRLQPGNLAADLRAHGDEPRGYTISA